MNQEISSECGSDTVLYLIRHGETDWNRQGILQGHADIPLNAEGELQAFKLKEKLRHVQFSKALSSDLSRALKTAEIVLDPRQVDILQTPILREITFGSWSGKSASQLKDYLKNFAPEGALTKEECISFKWDGAESYREVYARFRELIEVHRLTQSGSNVLLSSHGGVLRSVLYHLDFKPGFRWAVSNCAYLKLRVQKEGRLLLEDHDGIKPVEALNMRF